MGFNLNPFFVEERQSEKCFFHFIVKPFLVRVFWVLLRSKTCIRMKGHLCKYSYRNKERSGAKANVICCVHVYLNFLFILYNASMCMRALCLHNTYNRSFWEQIPMHATPMELNEPENCVLHRNFQSAYCIRIEALRKNVCTSFSINFLVYKELCQNKYFVHLLL